MFLGCAILQIASLLWGVMEIFFHVKEGGIAILLSLLFLVLLALAFTFS